MAACFTQGSVSLEMNRLKAGITLCARIMKGVMYHISECFMAQPNGTQRRHTYDCGKYAACRVKDDEEFRYCDENNKKV